MQIFKCEIASVMTVNAWMCASPTDRDLGSGLSESISFRTGKMVKTASKRQKRLLSMKGESSHVVAGSV